jgi:hypothetical protein
MSALGQKQTFAPQKAMSALPPDSDRKSGFPHRGHVCFTPECDMCSALAHVRFGPIADHWAAARPHSSRPSVSAVPINSP